MLAKTRTSIRTTAKRLLSTVKDPLITRVRIWQSGIISPENTFQYASAPKAMFAQIKPGYMGNVGHASLETRAIYASLWPREGMGVHNKHRMLDGVNSTLRQDIMSEQREPDHTVDLQTLDTSAIDKHFKVLDDEHKYHAVGNNKLLNGGEANNCVSFVFRLLMVGGIKALVPSSYLIQGRTIATPANLARIVITAKESEDRLIEEKGLITSDTTLCKT